MSSPIIRQKSPLPKLSPSGVPQLTRQSPLKAVSEAPAAVRLEYGTSKISFLRFNCTVFGVLAIILFIYTTVVLCVVSAYPPLHISLSRLYPLAFSFHAHYLFCRESMLLHFYR